MAPRVSVDSRLRDAVEMDMDAEVERICAEASHTPNPALRLLYAAPAHVLRAAHRRLWRHIGSPSEGRPGAAALALHDLHAARPAGCAARPVPVVLAAAERALARGLSPAARASLLAALESPGAFVCAE